MLLYLLFIGHCLCLYLNSHKDAVLCSCVLPRKLGKTVLHENTSPFSVFLDLRNGSCFSHALSVVECSDAVLLVFSVPCFPVALVFCLLCYFNKYAATRSTYILACLLYFWYVIAICILQLTAYFNTSNPKMIVKNDVNNLTAQITRSSNRRMNAYILYNIFKVSNYKLYISVLKSSKKWTSILSASL